MDPDPGGPKTRGSCGSCSGSPTLVPTLMTVVINRSIVLYKRRQKVWRSLVKSKTFGAAFIWLCWISIRIEVDPVPDARKTKTKKKTLFPAFQKDFCTFVNFRSIFFMQIFFTAKSRIRIRIETIADPQTGKTVHTWVRTPGRLPPDSRTWGERRSRPYRPPPSPWSVRSRTHPAAQKNRLNLDGKIPVPWNS